MNEADHALAKLNEAWEEQQEAMRAAQTAMQAYLADPDNCADAFLQAIDRVVALADALWFFSRDARSAIQKARDGSRQAAATDRTD